LRKEFDDLGKQAGDVLEKMGKYSWIDFLIKGTSPVATERVHKELDSFIKQFDDLARAQNKPAALELLVNTIATVEERLARLREEASKSRPGTNAAEIASSERFLQVLNEMNEAQGQASILQDNKNKLAKQDTTAKILADQAEAQRKLTAEQLANFAEYARVLPRSRR